MSRWSTVTLCAALALGGAGVTALRAEEATTQPAAQPQAGDAKAAKAEAKAEKKAEKKLARLTKPWSELPTLSEDQRLQIREIHGKALAEIKAIEAREKAEIMAVLNDEQKVELQNLLDKRAADRKAAKPETAEGETEGDAEEAPAQGGS